LRYVVPSLGEKPETGLGPLNTVVGITWNDVLVFDFDAAKHFHDDGTRPELITDERRGETDLAVEGRRHVVGAVEQRAVTVIAPVGSDRANGQPGA
jgi:hypothetical protein